MDVHAVNVLHFDAEHGAVSESDSGDLRGLHTDELEKTGASHSVLTGPFPDPPLVAVALNCSFSSHVEVLGIASLDEVDRHVL